MLGIHPIQAPFAALYGPMAQAKIASDINDRVMDAHAQAITLAHTPRQRMKVQPAPDIAPSESEMPDSGDLPQADRLAELIARLGEMNRPKVGGVLS